MAKKPFLRYYTETLAAGKELRKDFGGRWFICKESNGVFEVSFDDGAFNPCEVGIGFKHQDEDGLPVKFSSVILRNKTGAPITAGFYIGSTEVIDSRLNTLVDRTINVVVSSVADSYTKATTGVLAAGSSAAFSGYDGTKRRSTFSAFNVNPTAVPTDAISVLGQNAIVGHEIDPRQGYVVQSAGFIQLSNTTANAITYRVMETFAV